MEDKHKEILVKKFIDGKSYEDLEFYLLDIKFEGDKESLFRDLYLNHQKAREKVAIADLKKSVAIFLGFIASLITWAVVGSFPGRIYILIATGFMWIPFFRSFWVVYKSRKKFEVVSDDLSDKNYLQANNKSRF